MAETEYFAVIYRGDEEFARAEMYPGERLRFQAEDRCLAKELNPLKVICRITDPVARTQEDKVIFKGLINHKNPEQEIIRGDMIDVNLDVTWSGT